MPKYDVTVTELACAVVTVEAENKKAAKDQVEAMFNRGECSFTDYKDLDFEAELNPDAFYEIQEPKEITVLMVPNGKPPKPQTVENSMRAINRMMGGFVEIYPLEIPTVIIWIDRIGRNLIGLLPAPLGGGFCDVLHPVFVNGQAPRCTGIR